MLVADLLHSCANERVAAAAVCSIGGVFACTMQTAAEREGVSPGTLASRLVRGFAAKATERDWRDLHMSLRGHDLPMLAGLQTIVERETRRTIPAADLAA